MAKFIIDDRGERYQALSLNAKLSSVDRSDHYAEACEELAFILRRAYSDSPKSLQSLIFQDILSAFRLLPVFPMLTQRVISAANSLLQSAESSLPKKKKASAVTELKRAMVACKRRSKAQQEEQQGLHLAQLPEDVLLHIFSFLDLHSLASAAVVSRPWHAAALEGNLWELLYCRFFSDSEKCSSMDSLGSNKRPELKDNNDSQGDIVNGNSIDWREAFKEMYKGLSSKLFVQYRGYCRRCDLIVWLDDAKCYNRQGANGCTCTKIDHVTMHEIVEYVLYGISPSESSYSDSDSDDSSVFKLWDMSPLIKPFSSW